MTLTNNDVANQALDLLKEAPMTDYTTGTNPEDLWFQRNFVTSRDAELQEKPWRFAIKRRKLFPADFVVNASMSGTLSGAWGLMRLTPKWSGDLITIRRSSDSTTDDFSFDDEGNGITIDADGISTFVGSGSGYVTTLFDQSGNGRSLVQATTTKQPLYEAEEDTSGQPAASFDGTDDLLATSGAMSTLISTTAGYIVIAGLIDAATLDSATATSDHLLFGEAAADIGLYVRKGGRLFGYNNDGSADTVNDAVPLLVPFVAELRHLSGTLYTRVNGENEQSGTSGTTASLAGVFNIGDVAGSNALDFHMFAALTFSTAPTEAERNRLVERLMRWCQAGGAVETGWSYRYPIPDDCIRMLPLRENGDWEGDLIPHEIEQSYVLTDQSSYIWARYIQRQTDPNSWPALFVEALAAKMALKLSHWLTGKQSMTQTMAALYDAAIKRAKRADALESTPERAYDSDVIAVRYT